MTPRSLVLAFPREESFLILSLRRAMSMGRWPQGWWTAQQRGLPTGHRAWQISRWPEPLALSLAIVPKPPHTLKRTPITI